MDLFNFFVHKLSKNIASLWTVTYQQPEELSSSGKDAHLFVSNLCVEVSIMQVKEQEKGSKCGILATLPPYVGDLTGLVLYIVAFHYTCSCLYIHL